MVMTLRCLDYGWTDKWNYHTWGKVTSALVSSVIFILDYGCIRNTKPERFKKIGYDDIYSILDGTDFFTETPKNLDFWRITWSNYKQHNTLKALVCIAPNSGIFFYLLHMVVQLRIEIAVRIGYLDQLLMHSRIMYDKRFNIGRECTQTMISFSALQGLKGATYLTPNQVKKRKIANLRILVEQVMRCMKTFRTLASECLNNPCNH